MFRTLIKKPSTVLSEVRFTCPEKPFGKKIEKKRILAKIFDKFIKTLFCVSGGTFWLIFFQKNDMFFLDYEQKFLEFGPKSFGKLIKTAFRLSRRTIW